MGTENKKMRQGKCWFIVSQPGQPTVNCGKPTGYKMDHDPTCTEAHRRIYNSFCPEHQKWVDEHQEED